MVVALTKLPVFTCPFSFIALKPPCISTTLSKPLALNIELKIILDEVFALLKRKEKISMLELSTCMEKMNRLMEICKKE
jgi:hypothetical protein